MAERKPAAKIKPVKAWGAYIDDKLMGVTFTKRDALHWTSDARRVEIRILSAPAKKQRRRP